MRKLRREAAEGKIRFFPDNVILHPEEDTFINQGGMRRQRVRKEKSRREQGRTGSYRAPW